MHYSNVKFGIFTDLHLDIMHDGRIRLDTFIEQMKKEDVDFIIQLGDFCYPEDTSKCLCSEKNIPINLKNAMRVPADVKLNCWRNLINFLNHIIMYLEITSSIFAQRNMR